MKSNKIIHTNYQYNTHHLKNLIQGGKPWIKVLSIIAGIALFSSSAFAEENQAL